VSSESSGDACSVSADGSDDDPRSVRGSSPRCAMMRPLALELLRAVLIVALLRTRCLGRFAVVVLMACLGPCGRAIAELFRCASDEDGDELSDAPRCKVCYGGTVTVEGPEVGNVFLRPGMMYCAAAARKVVGVAEAV